MAWTQLKQQGCQLFSSMYNHEDVFDPVVLSVQRVVFLALLSLYASLLG